METPKEQAIKAAYGEHWDKVKDYVNLDNGIAEVPSSVNRTEYLKVFKLIATWPDTEGFKQMLIPYSLEGLENNRGWTRIESEVDLPKYNSAGDFYVMSNEGNKKLLNGGNAVRNAYRLKTITHWQLIETKLPIF
ncbi:hypothetical protein ATE49_15500 [Elizabethkingia miricola]|uniref:DUF551 domain-containing protein n=1 Tax=Elizabethkingia miricola TaxID=172045 RepID=A0ABY3NAE2_ELIMR|nr:hypothetical protein [Elizabethkingia miricola]OBS12788.1 hypothetical protein ATE49_15500 [Elizabethkingia miricola]TYO83770.1 hypothetical protein LX74_04047 [Elizabethkingia miricola]